VPWHRAIPSAISSALAQGYPERTVEITVPSSPGATADMLGRVRRTASPMEKDVAEKKRLLGSLGLLK
jgi:tripartite-type tricarboxylate transporter receptor subunit TctC